MLDDGAYFVQAASCFARGFPHLAVVEQTRRGVGILRNDGAAMAYADRIPVINVAEAPPKLEIESAFIGGSIAGALLVQVDERRSFIREGPVLLLGFGAIGSAVAEALVHGVGIERSRIHVLDPAADARDRARSAGFVDGIRERSNDPRYRLVVGCSGTTSFGVGDRVYLEDGAVLASASSGSAELSREGFVELADTHVDDDIRIHDRDSLPTRPIHSRIRIRLVDRDVCFLNGGFPINFDGRVNCVPFGRIQLTRALMLAGAVQANQTAASGLQPLDAETCDWIVRRYGALTGEHIPAAALTGWGTDPPDRPDR